jgi:hypothetical protein
MNLTPRWVHFLRNAGYEAIHWSSVGSNSAKDGEICDYARQSLPEVRGSALLGALQDCGAELNQGDIVTLDWMDKPRARVLPLRSGDREYGSALSSAQGRLAGPLQIGTLIPLGVEIRGLTPVGRATVRVLGLNGRSFQRFPDCRFELG